MIRMPGLATVPFHLIWVSLALIYGLRVWGPPATWSSLASITVATAAALVWAMGMGQDAHELLELPLMAAMLLVMVWHARRRQAALDEVRTLADRERDFVRDVSHQLRTPITVARGHVELIRSAGATGQIVADADVVLGELERLARTSERLLVLAAASQPEFLERQPVDVEELITGVARRWGASARRNWRVNCEVEGTVEADAERLSAALDALIENAIAFTAAGDSIGISAREDRGTLVIVVSDSGPGIPEDRLPRVFQRFAHWSSDGARKRDGTGLGLAIVKAIVEAHGGNVSVTSRPGAGTAFQLRLPGFRPGG